MTILSALTLGLFGNARPTETPIAENSDRGLTNPLFFEEVSEKLITLVREANKSGYHVTLKLDPPIACFDNDLDYLSVSGEFGVKNNATGETKTLRMIIKERDWTFFKGDKTYGPTIHISGAGNFGFGGGSFDLGMYTFLIQSSQDPKTWVISRTEGSIFNRKYEVTAFPEALHRIIKTVAAAPDPAHLTHFRGLEVTPIMAPPTPKL